MEFDEAYFWQVISKKKFGHAISEEEEQYIQEMLQHHEEARSLYKDLEEMYENPDFRAYWENHNPDQERATIISLAKKDRRNRRLRILSAAVVLSAVAGSIYFFLSKEPVPVENKDAVSLQLANGRLIYLPATKENPATIKTGSAVLKADSGILNVAALGSDPGTEWNTLTVPTGKMYTLVLADSTVIYLNAVTRLEFPFAFAHTREIRVNGEAYFKVGKDASRPFIVHTPLGTVQVLGTEFNINTYDSGTVRVALAKGAVRFRTAEKEATLKPGQEVISTKGKGITVQPFDEDERLGWLNGEYIFSGETLGNIMKVVKRHYGVVVIFDDPELARSAGIVCVIGKNMNLETFVHGLSGIKSIDIYVRQDTVHIRRGNQ